ncbi:MAG TPA: Lrp/AsnC family transcriptional regulator [Candidatus Poseidoniales archaeon]|nr:MAG TPA: Lrp/AsnC family transcriptional regulator [Candidatus Poseidoniales archaeon]
MPVRRVDWTFSSRKTKPLIAILMSPSTSMILEDGINGSGCERTAELRPTTTRTWWSEEFKTSPFIQACMELDATDRALLVLLSNDARVSHRSLARSLGIAQGTVTNRIRRMEEQGVIQGYSVTLDPVQLGWSLTIMAGLRIEKGRMIDVQQKISADPRVFAVYDVTGDWDSIVLARVQDRADLDNLTKTVFTLDGVSRSYTHVVLNTVKEQAFPSLQKTE